MPQDSGCGTCCLLGSQTGAALGDGREAPGEDGAAGAEAALVASSSVPLRCPSASCTGCQAGGKDHLDLRAAIPRGEGPEDSSHPLSKGASAWPLGHPHLGSYMGQMWGLTRHCGPPRVGYGEALGP